MGDLIEDRIIEEHERKKNEAYWKDRNAMTCRFEEEFNHKPYPRSCPTCGLAGKCSKGYTQIKNEGKPGYAIQAPNGQVNFYGPLGQPQGAQGPIGTTAASFPPPPPQPIPEGVYYNPDSGNFYGTATRHGMGTEFYSEWKHRKYEFPRDPSPIPERMGYTNDDPKLVRVIDTARRLTLMGWLVKNLNNTYTVKELDNLVDEVAAILLD